MAQTYPNWVAYCVDDGSKDKSWEILSEYAAKDNRIKIFHKENGGASSARNYALDRLENEEWLSFVDADDFVSPYMYEAIMSAIGDDRQVEYVRLYCQLSTLRYSQYVEKGWPNTVSPTPSEIFHVNAEDYFVEGQVGGFICSLFVKLNVVKSNNIRFCQDMRVLEDQVFSITCASYCNNFLILKEPRNYFYNSGNEQSVTRTNRDASDDIVRCINRVYDAFEKRASGAIMKDYFYGKHLPSKLASFYEQRFRHIFRRPSEVFCSRIKIDNVKLSTRTKIEAIFVKMFSCRIG